MFVITMESESTSWVALGNTEREAKEAISKKWNKYQNYLVRTGWKNEAEMMSAAKLDDEYGISIHEIEPGQCEMW